MISLLSLWLPILLSALFVFIVSSIIHMFLTYHKNDFRKVLDEDGVMDSLRSFNIPPGDYFIPRCESTKAMSSPKFIEKYTKGPVVLMTVFKSGPPSMTKNLIQWFIYCIIVGFLAAYITSRAVEPGSHYLEVFRFVGCTSFIGYSMALLQNSIWYRRSWCTTIKSMFDGLIYALVTAGTFGWLWPA